MYRQLAFIHFQIFIIKWTDKKFESMYSKLTEGIELRNSVRDNYNSMQENASTFLTKVKDLYMCSQNVDLQEKFNHLRVSYSYCCRAGGYCTG